MIYVKGGLSLSEKVDMGYSIRKNTIDSMHNILNKGIFLGIAPTDESLARSFREFPGEKITEEYATIISKLWNDKGIQEIWKRRSEYWHLDAVEYYMTNVHRFTDDPFVPTEEDCLMARVRTTGISETTLFDGEYYFTGKEHYHSFFVLCLCGCGIFYTAYSPYWVALFDMYFL